jgi:hypothetical protein
VSLGIPFHLKKKVRGGCELPGADMQKPYAPKFGKEKTKIAASIRGTFPDSALLSEIFAL